VSDLPHLLVLTDRAQSPRPLPDTIRAAVDGGARAVLLREKDLPPAERETLAKELADLLHPVAGRLIVAGGGLPTGGLPTGIHLAAADPLPGREAGLVVGRSCHGAREVAAAAAEGVDYVTVSPVFPTLSKPGYGPALGLAGLHRLVALAGVPVYALGGVDATNAAACREAGAAGVAVMGAVMRAADPATLVHHLTRAVGP
jgi:thiamine-phosphate diphosphorylase